MITTKKGLQLPESSEFVVVKENISDNFQKTEEFIINNDGAEVGYNGITYIQDAGQKVAGKLYYDKLQAGLWYCKTTTTSTVNDSNFEDYSNYANGNKLQNLDAQKYILKDAAIEIIGGVSPYAFTRDHNYKFIEVGIGAHVNFMYETATIRLRMDDPYNYAPIYFSGEYVTTVRVQNNYIAVWKPNEVAYINFIRFVNN